MARDMPTMVAAASSSAYYSGNDLSPFGSNIAGNNSIDWDSDFENQDFNKRMAIRGGQFKSILNKIPPPLQQTKETVMRRVVKVYIADPDENLSMVDFLLFQGSEKVTDATDQELFFELDIRGLLEKHNEKRVLVVNKKVKDRVEYLEPAKVRDLRMVVVTVASF